MDKDELIEYLRNNLKIKVEYNCTKSVYVSPPWYEVQLILGKEVISEARLPVITPDGN